MAETEKLFCVFILILLLSWYGFFIAQKIDLTTADLGRHLKNGELIITNFNNGIFKTNFYSYTHADYPFLNHHWGSGVVFFLVWSIAGFTGLSLFYVGISLFILFLFLRLSQKISNTTIAFITAFLLIPLIAERKEIRPEIFTYLFSGLFFWLLWHYKKNPISYRFRPIFVLPFIEVLWVNMHIYFFVGPLIIGVFLLEELIKRTKNRLKKIKQLTIAFSATAIACLLNPFGIKTLLYPLNMSKNYGYKIIENQSVWFLDKLGIINNPNLLLFKIVFVLLILSFVAVLIINRRRFPIALFVLSTAFSLIALFSIRNFTLAGLFALPALSYNMKFGIFQKFKPSSRLVDAGIAALIISIFVFSLANNHQRLASRGSQFGFGLTARNSASAEFFKAQNLKGPILNNYDIGGYLIYHLYPKEKVFVDNRPEAYPASFFEQIYIPLQENKNVWEKQDEIYNFNAIFFSHRDATPWGQKFLVERLNDTLWAPIFVDSYAVIFLKNNKLNKPIIEKYRIPKGYFRITKTQ
jgi:hypothetical protein